MSTTNGNPYESAEYDRFLLETAKDCRALDKPCPGCCAGGMCDGWLGGRFSEDYQQDEDDRDREEED